MVLVSLPMVPVLAPVPVPSVVVVVLVVVVVAESELPAVSPLLPQLNSQSAIPPKRSTRLIIDFFVEGF
jgi:hypothetical protein